MREKTAWLWTTPLIAAFLAFAALPPARTEEAAKTAEKVGAETCLSCHEKHDGFRDNIHAKAWPEANKIPFTESCETCHGAGSLHAGAGGDKSNPDFFTIRNPKKLAAKEMSESCMKCHQGSSRRHWEGSAHELRDLSCLSCHSMHGAKSKGGKSLLAKADEMQTCFQCHNTKKAQFQRSSHMPLHEGKMTCTNCHNAHGGMGPSLLKQSSVNDNCTTCHAEKKGPFLWEHPPVRENCLACHAPHGSQHDKLLKVKRPRLCQECHIEAQHPTSASTPGNLHVVGRSCTECHPQIHGSNHPSGVRFQR